MLLILWVGELNPKELPLGDRVKLKPESWDIYLIIPVSLWLGAAPRGY